MIKARRVKGQSWESGTINEREDRLVDRLVGYDQVELWRILPRDNGEIGRRPATCRVDIDHGPTAVAWLGVGSRGQGWGQWKCWWTENRDRGETSINVGEDVGGFDILFLSPNVQYSFVTAITFISDFPQSIMFRWVSGHRTSGFWRYINNILLVLKVNFQVTRINQWIHLYIN